ncbi:MAG: glycosyltransferase [Crocinitomicaceae bacterium]|nr:glycosyltransferase [Crocinitomicaceae bacterium]
MTTKKHILILPRWYPNKTDVQLGSFIQQQAVLLKEDYHIHVIYAHAIPNQGQTFDIESTNENGIEEHIVYFRQAKGPFKKIINARRYKKAQQLAFVLDPYHPAVCHIHVPYRSAFLALKLKKQGTPFVVTEHWSGHITGEYEQKNSADKRLLKSILAKASGIATVSRLLQQKFKENTGFDSVVIPNLIQKQQPEARIDSEKIDILTVADLTDKTKNISGLIRAFHTALQERNDLRLSIIGGGPNENLIRDLIAQLNLNEEVILRGRLNHEEVLPAYENCDFYVCNSNFETFGMAVAEAISAGKPVVCTRCGGPEEFVTDNNGLLIDKNDGDALSNAILRMADLYKNYDAQKLSEEIQAKFGAETIRQQLIDFYENAINDTRD